MSAARLRFCWVVLLLLLCASAQATVITASSVVSYTPGALQGTDLPFQNSQAALALPVGPTGIDPQYGFDYGALTPFNPPFQTTDIVVIGTGGQLTLQLSAPVPVKPGPSIGVFVNNGIISSVGTGLAGNPVMFLSPTPQAMVSVSADNKTWAQVNAAPIVFDIPTNVYTDTTISEWAAPLGTKVADFSKPFTGPLSDFNGLTYPQIVTLLNGSAGGKWLDLSGTGLSEVNYIRFDVPTGANYRMAVDAVTAVPEPAGLSLIMLGAGLLLRRRK